jgi:hypothetical protein
MRDLGIDSPLYLSPEMVVGRDPVGQLVASFRFVGEPNEKQLELMKRAIDLCNSEYLGSSYIYRGRWCCKLKLKEGYHGE